MTFRFGLQLYTLRTLAAENLKAVLSRIAEIGYEGVEFAGFYGYDIPTVQEALRQTGLKSFGAHIRLEDLREDLDRQVWEQHELGSEFVLIPWLDSDDRSGEGLDRLLEDIPMFAEVFAQASIQFGYHNHDFEFTTMVDSGETLWERLLSRTSNDQLVVELDPYWAYIGGVDPINVSQELGSRCSILQLKDASLDDSVRDVPCGSGRLDWNSLIKAAARQEVEYLIVEQDYPNEADPYGDVTSALRHAEMVVKQLGLRTRSSDS